jgi:hypothetical protein
MPDFTEILKIAVEEQDWKIICGLYTNITGEPLSVPDAETEPAEEEAEEEDILSKNFDMEEILGEKPTEETAVDNHRESMYNDFTAPPRTQNTDTTGRRMRSEPVGSRPLKNVVGVSEEGFVDDMSESLTDPETGEPLTGNNKNVKITPRNRRKELGMKDTSLIDATCSSCGENQKISPALAFGYSKRKSENTWTCNTCSTRKGRRARG